jgi:hypothetical protein
MAPAAKIAALPLPRWKQLFDGDAEQARKEYPLWAGARAIVVSIDDVDMSVELGEVRSLDPSLPKIRGGAWWPAELVAVDETQKADGEGSGRSGTKARRRRRKPRGGRTRQRGGQRSTQNQANSNRERAVVAGGGHVNAGDGLAEGGERPSMSGSREASAEFVRAAMAAVGGPALT